MCRWANIRISQQLGSSGNSFRLLYVSDHLFSTGTAHCSIVLSMLHAERGQRGEEGAIGARREEEERIVALVDLLSGPLSKLVHLPFGRIARSVVWPCGWSKSE